MPNNKIITNLISLTISIGFIALIIFLLPSLLILFGLLVLLSIIAGVVLKFVMGKENFKTNFIYLKRGAAAPSQELYEMKDVTNSNKKVK